MPRQPADDPEFRGFVLDLLKDPRTIMSAFIHRRVGTIYTIGGRIRGEYEVKGIYEGGQGAVITTYNHRHRRPYALKTLREELLLSQRARSSFERECRFWIGLGKHPYTIQAFFTPRMSGRLFVAIEPVEPDGRGRITLLEHIQEGGLPPEQLALWASQVCCAIEYAQRKGMTCHRDLKPSNILIDRAGTARVTDFGCVKTDEYAPSGSTYLAGTLPYIAPEILEGRARSDVWRDVWSFGITLYQSATGRLPWIVDSSNPRLWVECIRTCELEKLDNPLWPVIKRCLELNSKDRYSSFEELRADLSRVYQGVTGREFIPLAAGPETPEDLLNRGFSEHLLGNPEAAIGFYKRGLAGMPPAFDCGRLWHNLGRVYVARSEPDAAEDCFQKASEVAPDLDRPWIDWARLRLAQGDLTRAIELLECAKMAGGTYVDVWLALGDFYKELGEWEKASEHFDTAIQIDSTDSDSWWGKGECKFMLGQKKEARVALQAAVTIEPTRVGIFKME